MSNMRTGPWKPQLPTWNGPMDNVIWNALEEKQRKKEEEKLWKASAVPPQSEAAPPAPEKSLVTAAGRKLEMPKATIPAAAYDPLRELKKQQTLTLDEDFSRAFEEGFDEEFNGDYNTQKRLGAGKSKPDPIKDDIGRRGSVPYTAEGLGEVTVTSPQQLDRVRNARNAYLTEQKQRQEEFDRAFRDGFDSEYGEQRPRQTQIMPEYEPSAKVKSLIENAKQNTPALGVSQGLASGIQKGGINKPNNPPYKGGTLSLKNMKENDLYRAFEEGFDSEFDGRYDRSNAIGQPVVQNYSNASNSNSKLGIMGQKSLQQQVKDAVEFDPAKALTDSYSFMEGKAAGETSGSTQTPVVTDKMNSQDNKIVEVVTDEVLKFIDTKKHSQQSLNEFEKENQLLASKDAPLTVLQKKPSENIQEYNERINNLLQNDEYSNYYLNNLKLLQSDEFDQLRKQGVTVGYAKYKNNGAGGYYDYVGNCNKYIYFPDGKFYAFQGEKENDYYGSSALPFEANDYYVSYDDKIYYANSMETIKLSKWNKVDEDFMETKFVELMNRAQEKGASLSRILTKSFYLPVVGKYLGELELDFKRQLSSDTLYNVNGVLYNKNEMGNLMWSYFLQKNGYGDELQEILAQAGSLAYGRTDEPWDTRARWVGVSLAKLSH